MEIKELLDKAELWCAINAYDEDKGVCNRHTIDDCRGYNCSADELLQYLQKLVKTEENKGNE